MANKNKPKTQEEIFQELLKDYDTKEEFKAVVAMILVPAVFTAVILGLFWLLWEHLLYLIIVIIVFVPWLMAALKG